ncbi:unnamed protein product [Phytomonas sp. Hart1]|nr:unnamed protein product [Phytomonas sp. Hart1]|eukprot:CCW66161.1 unnamed protein product [Phytomonas sp. isolate Hart1]
MESTGDPSLSVVTLVGKAVALGFGSKLVVSLSLMNGMDGPGLPNSVIIDDNQMIRAITFVQFSGGPLCVVTAGDAKYINVYNLDSLVHCNPDTSHRNIANAHSEENTAALQLSLVKSVIHEIRPCYRHGPHTKRILSMITDVDGGIIFADKFGEVYRLPLSWNPSSQMVEGVTGDGKTPAMFLFQHFSLISTLYLCSPIPPCGKFLEECGGRDRRRIFSCDKDHHCRVSHYPEVYNIEQFLWPQSGKAAVITCVEEIPFLARKAADASVRPSHTAEPKAFSYYVSGNCDGEVFFWVARNDLSRNAPEEPFQLVSTGRPESSDGTRLETGAVLSVVYLACGLGAPDSPGPPCDSPGGVLVAYEKLKAIVLFQLSSTNENRPEGYHSLVVGGRIQLEQFPVAMVRYDESTALIVDRDGATTRVHLSGTRGLVHPNRHMVGDMQTTAPELHTSNNCTNPELRLLPHVETPLEDGIKNIITLNGINLLSKLNLFAQWQYIVSDPQTRNKNLCRDNTGENVNVDQPSESNKISHSDKNAYNINKRVRSDNI